MFHVEGQRDKYDESNSRFSQFCDRAQKIKKRPSCTWSKSQHTRRAREFNELRTICFHFSSHIHIPIFDLRTKISALVTVICQQNLQNVWEAGDFSNWWTSATVGSKTLNSLPSIIYKITNKSTSMFVIYFIRYILTHMFRPLLRPSSGWYY
jgi:hypothetical protein